ncbi:MAG: hypothetical protein WBF81_03655 [Thermoplasmata archaeon]
MEERTRADSPDTTWIVTARPQTRISSLSSFATLGIASNRADVDRIGIGPAGVTFVRKRETVTIPWDELAPSNFQYGKRLLVLLARDGTPRRGGPWTVEADQGRAILTDARWPAPEYARKVVPQWLS